MKRVVVLFCLTFGILVQPCGAQSLQPDEPEANPGRPTVSTPATLTPVGYLQFETGFTAANDSPEFSSRYSLGEAIKLSVAPRLEFLVVGEGVLYHGEGAKPTLAVSYFHRVYDGGAPEFDYGSPINSFLVLGSADVRGFHYDANAFFTELGQGAVRRAQYGQSLTISHPLVHGFTLSGEIWHFTQPFLRSNAVGNLWAVSYVARKNLVLDAGFNHGLTRTSTQWEAFVGFTYLLPRRLWSGGNALHQH